MALQPKHEVVRHALVEMQGPGGRAMVAAHTVQFYKRRGWKAVGDEQNVGLNQPIVVQESPLPQKTQTPPAPTEAQEAAQDTEEGEGEPQAPESAADEAREAQNSGSQAAETPKSAEKSPEELPDTEKVVITREDLDAKSFKQLQRLAKDMGLTAGGPREVLTERILSADDER